MITTQKRTVYRAQYRGKGKLFFTEKAAQRWMCKQVASYAMDDCSKAEYMRRTNAECEARYGWTPYEPKAHCGACDWRGFVVEWKGRNDDVIQERECPACGSGNNPSDDALLRELYEETVQRIAEEEA